MLPKIATTILWIAIVYFVYVLLLFLLQRNFLYFQVSDDATTHAPAYELKTESVTLRGWVINPGKNNAILYYGGNAERLSYTIDVADTLFDGFSVYLVHYRGYGQSEGTPSEQTLYADALAVYDDIKHRHQNIAVIGRSLGSSIATHVGSQREVSHVVLITPFDSIENIAKDRYIGVPISLLLKDKHESWKRVNALTSKTLVIVAENDSVVPRRFSDALLNHFRSDQVSSHILAETSHNTVSSHPQYYPLIHDFLSAP